MADIREAYLQAMEAAVTNSPFSRVRLRPRGATSLRDLARNRIIRWLDDRGLALTVGRATSDGAHLDAGWTMAGRNNVRFVRAAYEAVRTSGVAGDLIETGVWRGGVTMYMKALLIAFGDESRSVWVADSFEGVPPPSQDFVADIGDRHHTDPYLSVSLDEVRTNFATFGLLDSNVRFLEGWFRDTLFKAPIEKLALARLDGDLYQSTMESLVALYPRCEPGAVVIIDDYSFLPCRQAVQDFRDANRITDEIHPVNVSSAYWRKGTSEMVPFTPLS